MKQQRLWVAAIAVLASGLLASGAFAQINDCNTNQVDDAIDISAGTSFDCNNDGVPDECIVCPPVDVVFTMDTSGSMNDESAALCNTISGVSASLLTNFGITANTVLWGITNHGFGGFSCLTSNVAAQLGGTVPGNDGTCDGFLNQSESWGQAAAVVAVNYPWTPGSVRVVVPISDEGGCNGNSCLDPGSDRDAVTNAIAQAQAQIPPVFLSPIAGTGSNTCVINTMTDMASQTGGVFFQSTSPNLDIAQAISNAIVGACAATFDCNQNQVPDDCDLDPCDLDPTDPDGDGVVFDDSCNSNGVPDICEVDCNCNGVDDADDIAAGTSFDINANGIPDECEVSAEICDNGIDDDGDGLIDDLDVDDCVPLLIELASFTATPSRQSVRIDWTTSLELDNYGFRLLRGRKDDPAEALQVITPSIILAVGSETTGASYQFVDLGRQRKGTVLYYLEDIDRYGQTTLHGPIEVDIRRTMRSGARGKGARLD